MFFLNAVINVLMNNCFFVKIFGNNVMMENINSTQFEGYVSGIGFCSLEVT